MDSVTGVMSQMIGPSTDAERALRESERKFVVPALVAARFLARIEARTALEIADPARPVEFNRTTYLDTSDLAYLRSSQSGLARKLRIREYASSPSEGIAAEPTTAFLELKETGGGFRSKTRARLEGSLAALLAADTASPSIRLFQTLFREQRPVPMLTTCYRRVRRTCLELPVRITVDTDIRFSPPVEPGSELFADGTVARIPSSIIELKSSSGDLPAWLVAELDARTEEASFSKFECGMRLLGERT